MCLTSLVLLVTVLVEPVQVPLSVLPKVPPVGWCCGLRSLFCWSPEGLPSGVQGLLFFSRLPERKGAPQRECSFPRPPRSSKTWGDLKGPSVKCREEILPPGAKCQPCRRANHMSPSTGGIFNEGRSDSSTPAYDMCLHMIAVFTRI